MDEHNPPLWSTPAYSFLLWLVYEAFGVGLWQTRLLSALGGAVTCFAVYGFVRREASPRAAFAAALLLAADYFLLTNNRVAFTESLQLAFATVAILAALRSRAAPAWGALSGACVLAAVLLQADAVAAGAAIGALYLALVAAPGRPPAGAPRRGAGRGCSSPRSRWPWRRSRSCS